MKQTRVIFFLLLFSTISEGQNSDFELSKIKFKGLEFTTTKEKIVKVFGQGERVDADDVCGFSSDQTHKPYYQLVYTDFNYLGSDKGKFYLWSLTFDNSGRNKISYDNKELSGRTTKEELVKIIGDQAKVALNQNPNSDSLLLYSKGGEEGGRFTFKDGRLIKFEYWVPC